MGSRSKPSSLGKLSGLCEGYWFLVRFCPQIYDAAYNSEDYQNLKLEYSSRSSCVSSWSIPEATNELTTLRWLLAVSFPVKSKFSLLYLFLETQFSAAFLWNLVPSVSGGKSASLSLRNLRTSATCRTADWRSSTADISKCHLARLCLTCMWGVSQCEHSSGVNYVENFRFIQQSLLPNVAAKPRNRTPSLSYRSPSHVTSSLWHLLQVNLHLKHQVI